MTTNGVEVCSSEDGMPGYKDTEVKDITDNLNNTNGNLNGTSVDSFNEISADDGTGDETRGSENTEEVGQQPDVRREEDKNNADSKEDTDNSAKTSEFVEDELSDPCLDFMSDPADMTPEVREKTYMLGEELKQKGKSVLALKCFLRCLSGLDNKKRFPHISQCLRNVAELYYSMEEYDKAVQFIQAEKVYYESELIDSSDIFQLTNEKDEGNAESVKTDSDEGKVDVKRAQEFATLAQLCLDHDQPLMALEYQAKATKLRQKLLGNDHPITQKSLYTFTVMYAEAGKKQYSESLKKCEEIGPQASSAEQDCSGLRQRKKVIQDEKRNDKKLGHDEVSDTPEDPELVIPMFLLITLVVLCAVMVLGSVYYLYCRDTVGADICISSTKLTHYYNRISYMLSKLTKWPWNQNNQ